jgi:hypothetical protein
MSSRITGLAENAGWDDELLRIEIASLKEDQFDIDLLGFDDADLERLLAEEPSQGLTDEDAVPEAAEAPVTAAGDLWILGEHRVLCGDATKPQDVERLLNGVLPMLMGTDPPYGVAYDPAWRAKAGVNENRRKLGQVNNDHRVDWRDAWRLFRAM